MNTGAGVLKKTYCSLLAIAVGMVFCGAAEGRHCNPTKFDEIGPFYRQNAPVRNKIGNGYVLYGKVLDTECRPVPGAEIEVWQAGPNGEYGDAHRATIYPDKKGNYRLESDFRHHICADRHISTFLWMQRVLPA